MMQAADGGLGSIGVKTLVAESSAEIFEKRAQSGLSELRKIVAEALKGASSNEVLERIMALAQERAHDTKANLDILQEGLEDEGASIEIKLGDGVSEAIRELDETAQNSIREAVAKFEQKAIQAVRESAAQSGGVESTPVIKESADEKIARLEAEIKSLEAKREKREAKSGVKSLVRENKTLESLRGELEASRGSATPEASTGTDKADSPGEQAAEAVVQKPGIPRSFAEGALALQRRNAEAAEAKLGDFIEALLKKADSERADRGAAFAAGGAKEATDARFEQDKPILIARHLVQFLDGDKRIRRKTPNEYYEKTVDAEGREADHMMEDLSGPDEYETYIAGTTGFSKEGVLRLAKNKYGYTGEDAAIEEAIRAQAGVLLSAEKKSATGDFAKGVATAEKQAAAREELDRLSERLGVLRAEEGRLGTAFAETDRRELDVLKARREELVAIISGVAVTFGKKKSEDAASVAGNKDGTHSSPIPEPVTPGSPPVDQAPVVESSPVDEQAKKREVLLAKIRDNTEKLEALRAKRGAKDKPSAVESLLAISLKQLSIDLAKLDPPADAKASIPPPDVAAPPAKDVIPDPVPPVIPVSPDAAPVKPDASAKLTVFEQRVADDEARLEKIQSLIDAWSSPENAGKPAMSKDGAIRAYVDWYRSLVVAERALVQASGDEEKAKANADIEARLKAKPRGDGSFQRLSETVARYVSSTDDSKKMRGWKEVLASRQAVLDLLGESLNTRDGRGADAVAASAKKTPEPVPVDSSDAEIKKIPFEQRVAEDEARLSRIDALTKEANPPGEGTPLLVGVKDWVNWYKTLHAADRSLINMHESLAKADKPRVRNNEIEKVKQAFKAQPSGNSSLEETQRLLDSMQANLDASPDFLGHSPAWVKAWEAGKAIWALVMEGRAAQGLKTLDAKAATDPKASTPDTKAAPDTQPSPDATPDPDPAVAAAEGPEYGPKTLQEAFDHENALVRRLSGDIDGLKEIAGLDDAPLKGLLVRAEESLQVFEQLVKESDADEQMKLAAERAAFLESTEAQKSVEACFDNLYAAISSLSPVEVKSETGFTARVEALTLLSELFPAVKERLPPLKKTLQETLASVPPGKEPEKTPEELLERDRELISRLEKLVLASHAVGELDTPDPDQEHGELDRVMLGVHTAAELLELADQEEDSAAREKLLVEYSIILKDPKIQESAEAYMEKISDLLRTMEPDAVRADAQIRNRIETLEVLAEIFPDLAKKIPTLKTKIEQAGLVSLEEREAWQAEIDRMSLRLTTLQKILEDAKDDKWYQENKASVDAGLAFRANFQAGLTERLKTLLAAKTFAERRAADEEIVKFRRESALTPPPPLLPDASSAKTKIKIKELEKEVKIIKDEQGKKAAQEKQAELEALKRYTLILELQKDIRSEAALQSLPSDAEIVDRQARAKEENVFKKEGEIKAPTSVDGIRLGMQNNSEKQLAETTSAVRLARETRAFFSEALAGFNPHPEIGERFSPIYTTWKEEQEAHFELLNKERHYNLLDHLEIGVTQALRSLDRLGSGSLSPEAAQTMWEGFPGVVRKLLAKGGEGDFASSLAPEDRNVETIKGWLYESLRKTTQDKLAIGQALEAALANADTFTGQTKRLAAETRAQLEKEMTALEQEHKRLEMELQQKQPGGVSHKEVRWTQEGHRLQFELMVARQKMARLKDQHKDLLDMEAIFNDPQREDPSVEDEEGYLALELRRESSERMVAIMQRQNERTAALTAQDKARTDALKANPGLMAKAIITSASGKKSVEAKSNDGGGGKSEPGSLLNDLKNSWAAKLAKPFTDLFSGWFGGK